MVHNKMIACDFCKTRIRLRIQVGYFDIPFRLKCPECSTKIRGTIRIGSENLSLECEVEYATEVDIDISNVDSEYYIAELSAEFLTRKLHKSPHGSLADIFELSPFLNMTTLYGETAIKDIQTLAGFTEQGGSTLQRIRPLFELFWNGYGHLLFPRLKDEISQYPLIPLKRVTNDFDAAVALHQLFITTSGVADVLAPGELVRFTEIGQSLLTDPAIVRAISSFLDAESVDLDDLEKKAITLIAKFFDVYEQLIPVVGLVRTDRLDRVDRDVYGIMTTSYDDLSSFYAESYEWILDCVPYLAALNNVVMRGSYNLCANGNTYNDVLKTKKFDRAKFLTPGEPLALPLADLRNRVRNSIQHFDHEIDDLSQVISFKDRYSGKLRTEHLYLVDFAALCVSNFTMVIYLLEVIYNLRKARFVKLGVIPSLLTPLPGE